MKVLDTTFLIDLLNGVPETRAFFEMEADLLTTQINMYEILVGLFYKKVSPRKILEAKELFKDIRVIPLDDEGAINAAKIDAELTSKGQIIEDCDCLVAGIAFSRNINTIITRNVKDFGRIKGIKVETY